MTAAPDAPAAGPAGRPVGRRPRLVAVPDSEPPLEPLPPDPDAVRSDRAERITFAPWPGTPVRPPLRAVGGARRAASDDADPSSGRRQVRIAHRRCAPAGPLATMPISAVATARRPVLPARRAYPRIVTSRSAPDWSTDREVGVRPTPSAALPTALDTGTGLARGLLEALSGRRTLAQLRTHCAPDVFAGLVSLDPLSDPAPQLLTLWVCEPADGVAEISATFRCGTRTRALAMRLMGIDGRWRITALHLG